MRENLFSDEVGRRIARVETSWRRANTTRLRSRQLYHTVVTPVPVTPRVVLLHAHPTLQGDPPTQPRQPSTLRHHLRLGNRPVVQT
jgi:hypothetical protein